MGSFQPQMTVAECIARHPRTNAIFADHCVDTCCGGRATLAEAAVIAGVPVGRLLAALERVVQKAPERSASLVADVGACGGGLGMESCVAEALALQEQNASVVHEEEGTTRDDLAAGARAWERAMRRKPGGDQRQERTLSPDAVVADLIEAFPATLQVLVELGFKPLGNPLLRRTLARRVTLAQACAMQGHDLAEVLERLRPFARVEMGGPATGG